jgi:MFS superfamily sulfate permease-like transporter
MSPHAPHIPRDLTSDLLAGFVVALVALPRCLAIALAS